MPTAPTLSAGQRDLLATTRRAVLVTLASDGRPRPIPICLVVADEFDVIYTPLDDKPKRADDPLALARLHDIASDPRVSVLADRWDEDWTRLGWVRCRGRAMLLEPACEEHVLAVASLRVKYAQYAAHRLEERPIIRIDIEEVASWGALVAPPGRPA